MRRYVLDTNLYIAAARDRVAAEELERFYATALDAVYLHAIVAQEIMAGAVAAGRPRSVRNAVIEPFASRRRLLTPAFADFVRSGEVMADLARDGHLRRDGYSRSFLNDTLLAVCCRAEGLTLVTRNLADFERIGRVLDFEFVAPWPGARDPSTA